MSAVDFWHQLSPSMQLGYLRRVAPPTEFNADDVSIDDVSILSAASYPDGNPKTIMGEAKPKMSDTPVIGIRLLGQVHTHGAEKYGRFNWREHNVSSSVYYDAAMRHITAWFDGEDNDPDTGLSHLAHVMAGMNIILDAQDHKSLNDNRPKNLGSELDL